MRRVANTAFKFCTQPCKGFTALRNSKVRQEVEGWADPKLDALAQVVLSLRNKQLEYVGLLLAEHGIQKGGSVLDGRVLSPGGHKLHPIQYYYQQAWQKDEWKETNLLQYILSDDKDEGVEQEETEAVKDSYDVELSSLDAGQKIKAIKAIREIFNLGLKEAKDFADKVPSVLKKDVKTEEAEKLKAELEKVGCVITLK